MDRIAIVSISLVTSRIVGSILILNELINYCHKVATSIENADSHNNEAGKHDLEDLFLVSLHYLGVTLSLGLMRHTHSLFTLYLLYDRLVGFQGCTTPLDE